MLLITTNTTFGFIRAVTLADSLKQLQTLDMSNNPLADDGVVALCSVFKFNKTLRELILQKCLCTESGAEKIGEMLKKNKTLMVLDVSRNSIGDKVSLVVTVKSAS